MVSDNYIPTKWEHGKTVGTADIMNNIENGILEAHERVSDVENKTNDYLKKICVMMPLSSDVDENTFNLQSILDMAKNKDVSLTVQFPSGYYELKTCVIYDNTTIKLTNNTILKNVVEPVLNEYRQYNVNPNILINAGGKFTVYFDLLATRP